MSGRKEYELMFRLQVALGGNFHSSFQSAMAVTNRLQGTIVNLHAVQGKIDGYQKQTQAIQNTKNRMGALNAEQERLKDKMNRIGPPTEALTKKFERNERQIRKTADTMSGQERRLRDLGRELRNTGVDTGNLRAENDRLTLSYERAKREQEAFVRLTTDQVKNKAAISDARGQLFGTFGRGGGAGGGGVRRAAAECHGGRDKGGGAGRQN